MKNSKKMPLFFARLPGYCAMLLGIILMVLTFAGGVEDDRAVRLLAAVVMVIAGFTWVTLSNIWANQIDILRKLEERGK